MKKLNFASFLTAGVAAVLLAVCASKATTPTTADRMRAHATAVQTEADLKNRLAADWDKGQKMIQTGRKNVETGETRVKKAEQELKKGAEQIERGNKEILEGQALVEEAERRFREEFPDLELGGGEAQGTDSP